MKKILICDFDGTLIKENIEKRLLAYLLREKKLIWYQYILAVISLPINLLRKKIGKGNLFSAWSAFLSVNKYNQLIHDFLEMEAKKITLNSEVLDYIKDFNGKKVLLTGSRLDLVKKYLLYYNQQDLFDEIIGTQTDRRGFIIKIHPYGKEKMKYIRKYNNTVGIGNEYADRYFLKLCKEVIVVNPDDKLEQITKKNNWKLIRCV